MFGLNILLDLPHPINQYYEPELKCDKVVYDCDGWPVHPVTQERTRIINESSELCLNTIFFLAFPMFIIWVAIQNACHCYENSCEEKCLPHEQQKCKNYQTVHTCKCRRISEKVSLKILGNAKKN